MWYYVKNNQRVGPVNRDVITNLIHNGSILRETLVWTEGMDNWQKAVQTEFSSLFADVPPAAVSGSGLAIYQHPAITFQPRSLRVLWLWFVWLIGIGFPLSFVIVGLPAVNAGYVIGYILLYRFWLLIQDGNARTTAGKAVGFCFIPFFNLYWMYVAYVGLSKDLNAYCNERNIAGKQINEGLALTWYILSLVSAVPYLGLLTCIPTVVIYIILTKQFTDLSMKVLEHKTRGQITESTQQ